VQSYRPGATHPLRLLDDLDPIAVSVLDPSKHGSLDPEHPTLIWPDMGAEHRVAIVASKEYAADRVEQLAGLYHVWAPRTAETEAVSRRIWSRRPDSDADRLLTGLTLFKSGGSQEENLLWILEEVELHHGEASQDPPVGVIEVLGFFRLDPSGEGFTAYRDQS
jgi:hypothetical protein